MEAAMGSALIPFGTDFGQRREVRMAKVTTGTGDSGYTTPGDPPPGAALDLARRVIRGGERLVARLYHEGVVQNGDVLRYLNRLSDAVFIRARYREARQGGSPGARPA